MGRKELRKRGVSWLFTSLGLNMGWVRLNIYTGSGLSDSVQAGETISCWRKPWVCHDTLFNTVLLHGLSLEVMSGGGVSMDSPKIVSLFAMACTVATGESRFLPNILPTLPQWPSAEMEPEQAGPWWEEWWKIKFHWVHVEITWDSDSAISYWFVR